MISNCNPLNIRYRSEGYWQGQAPSRGCPQFCRFYDLKWGFRAAFRLMQTYYEHYHLDTVEKIVGRWAPPTENDTRGYVRFVVGDLQRQWTDISAQTALPHPREHPRLWTALALAMAKMECGPRRIGLAEAAACEEGYHLLFD